MMTLDEMDEKIHAEELSIQAANVAWFAAQDQNWNIVERLLEINREIVENREPEAANAVPPEASAGPVAAPAADDARVRPSRP